MFHPVHKYFTFFFFTLCLFSPIQTAVTASSGSSCCQDNIINVNGFSKVSVQPDIAIVSITASNTAKTSQQAVQKVAQQINLILAILKKNGVKEEDINTQAISIFPQYDYPNGTAVLTGQTAQQTLSVTIRNINKNGGNLGSFIDQLVAINGIQFNGLTFDKENKTEAQKLARKLAFQDAKQKALEYAELSQRTLGKVLTINDNAYTEGTPVVQNNAIAVKSLVRTSVPVGAIEISYTVNIRFALR